MIHYAGTEAPCVFLTPKAAIVHSDSTTQADSPRSSRFKSVSFWVRLVFTGLIIGIILWQIDESLVVEVFRKIHWGPAVAAALCYLLGTLVRGLRWYVLIKSTGMNAPLLHVIGLFYMGEFANNTLPAYAGEFVRSIDLDGIQSSARSAGVVIIDRLLGLLTLFITALAVLPFVYDQLPQPTAFFMLVAALGGTTAIGLVLWKKPVLWVRGRLSRRLSAESWFNRLLTALVACPPSAVILGGGLSLIAQVTSVLYHFGMARALGITLPVSLFFIFAPIIIMGSMLPTIGGLGIREIGYAFLLAPFGVPQATAVSLGFGLFLLRLVVGPVGISYYLAWNVRQRRLARQ